MTPSRYIASLAVTLLMLSSLMTASASLVDGSGNITSWGFKPFGTQYGDWLNGPPPGDNGLAGNETGQDASVAWSEGNNVSPVDYNKNGHYIPAPGGSLGEKFDLEFLAWRVQGNRVQVLGISSANLTTGVHYGSHYYHVGDVFIDVDGNASNGYKGFDMALTAGNWSTNMNDPLHPGDAPYSHSFGSDLFKINGLQDVHGVTNIDAYGGNPVIANQVNPFAVRNGATEVANAGVTMVSESYNYGIVDGHDENNTWITQWEFNLSALGIDPKNIGNIRLQWTIECGNDVVKRGPREDEPIPEPATIALMGLGLVTMGVMRRRIRR